MVQTGEQLYGFVAPTQLRNVKRGSVLHLMLSARNRLAKALCPFRIVSIPLLNCGHANSFRHTTSRRVCIRQLFGMMNPPSSCSGEGHQRFTSRQLPFDDLAFDAEQRRKTRSTSPSISCLLNWNRKVGFFGTIGSFRR